MQYRFDGTSGVDESSLVPAAHGEHTCAKPREKKPGGQVTGSWAGSKQAEPAGQGEQVEESENRKSIKTKGNES